MSSHVCVCLLANIKPKHTYMYVCIHKHHTQIFEEVVPQILPLLEEHGWLGHAGIVDHCQILIYRCHIKEEAGKKEKEEDFLKYIIINA